MITEILCNKKQMPKVLVENKISFAGPESELSIYDTYEQAERVKLKSDQLLFCAMVSGKKVMHADKNDFVTEFIPHESFIMAPNQTVEIDFPIAQWEAPTTCLAIEVSLDRVKDTAQRLNQLAPLEEEFGFWDYSDQLIHTHHNNETEALLNRIVHIYTENHPDRNFMIDLAVSELTVRLLRQQTRDFMLNFCNEEPDNNGLNAVLNYITHHLSDSLDINYLCKVACMSRTKFFIQFKRHLGCTPMAFQHQMRLKKAGLLIKHGKQITQVCFELGFNNASHFCRSFKQFYGMSARDYKTRHLSS
ncbi:helix-turn-helix domain-containing protein [Pseudocolwellia sp. HL-MZ19]|uniref:helix-turn-helix domain-containing protein n=1 Tax=unclassified Pseudocolwellia TaxID=2848178 RepID=UPI003CF291B2